VHQVGNQYIINSWCTVRKTSSQLLCSTIYSPLLNTKLYSSLDQNPFITTRFIGNLVHNVSYSVVPIYSPLLNTKLYSSLDQHPVITTRFIENLVHNVSYSVVPIYSPLLNTKLYSSLDQNPFITTQNIQSLSRRYNRVRLYFVSIGKVFRFVSIQFQHVSNRCLSDCL